MKKITLFLLACCFWNCTSQVKNNTTTVDKGTLEKLEKDLKTITKTPKARNYKNVKTLNNVASFIKEEFYKVCDSASYQSFNIDNITYKNVIGSLGIENKKRIIIGAHYDVCGNSEGADDNASGVVGLLALARKLAKEKLKYRIDFVAYTLEEPPFFRTQQMGSYIHAKYLKEHHISVKGMLCLESIGFFDERPNSQHFPVKEMSLQYGTTGNFIALVQNNNAKEFSNEVKQIMDSNSLIATKTFKGNATIRGIDFSDHLNYWNFGYDAVMLTNTAFFRNKNYHTENDKLKTLDLNKMALVIEQTFQTIKKIK